MRGGNKLISHNHDVFETVENGDGNSNISLFTITKTITHCACIRFKSLP